MSPLPNLITARHVPPSVVRSAVGLTITAHAVDHSTCGNVATQNRFCPHIVQRLDSTSPRLHMDLVDPLGSCLGWEGKVK